ncbi:hypothetical protein ACTFIW_004942 [Dictyostelium discoideum]
MSTTKIHNSYNDVPSAVLHIRSIPQGTTENDLFKITFDHKFGKCVSVRILERFHQALLEMDSVESATRLLKYSQKNSLLLHGKPVQISFSKSQSINQPTPQSPTNTTTTTTNTTSSSSSSSSSSSHRSSPSSSSSYNGLPQAGSRQSNFSPNTNNSAPIAGTVLLSTIENPGSNSITIDHLYHVFSSCGEVLRIVMFNKNNLQALIEFSTVESALNAKKTLSNHSLFHGGQCTLKLEVSKTDRLNITQNTDRAKDFSKSLPTVNQSSSSSQQQQSYYQSNGNNNNNNNNQQHHSNNHHHQSSSSSSSPSQGSHHHHHNSNNNNNNHHSHHHSSPSHPHHSGSVSTNQQVGNHHSHHHGHNHHGGSHHHHNSHQNGGNIGHHRTTVLLVHGLDEAVMTCDRIFNLFCVYGNVQRVKILSSKKGAALVQMEDVQQAEAVIRFYHQMPLFKDTLQINYSKHLSITDSHNPESPTLSKDFAQSNLNRFTHPINTYKHLYKPSQTLYFSNVPKDFTETNFNQLFQSLNLQKPVGFKIFSAQLAPGSSSVPTVASPTTPTGVVTGVSSPSVNGGGAGSGASTVGTNIANNTTTSVNGISSNSSTPEPSKHADKIVGLLEFSSPANAIDALVLLNNSVLPNSNHMGLRLSFSNSTVLPKSSTSNNNNNNTNNTTTTTTTSTNTNNSNNITSPQQPQQFQQPQQPQQQSPTTQKLF